MDTANLAAIRRPEIVTDHESPPAPEAVRQLTVLVVYELSETGRKASLVAGGDGRALQQLEVQLSANRLHLVAVDARGTARLKLRPRFEMDAEQRVVRKDTVPVYDAPPTLETLIHEAARNHQLERVYKAERNLARLKRQEAEQARRTQIAEEFLADKTQRALVHPTPSPVRCSLSTGQGRILFDVATDLGVARNVPAEAHRRYRADFAAKKEKNLRERAAQLALHEEKKRFIAKWVEQHGTEGQKERQQAGSLLIAEAVEAVTDRMFSALVDLSPYSRDGLAQLENRLRRTVSDPDLRLSKADVQIRSCAPTHLRQSTWDFVKTIRTRVPNASVAVREHHVTLRRYGPTAASLSFRSVVVSLQVGPLLLRREYSEPDSAACVMTV